MRLRPFTSTSSFHARSLRLPADPIIRFNTIAHPSRRAFSQTTSCARRPDLRDDPGVDYDPSLGDPWAPYRLRNAKPLTRGDIFRSPLGHAFLAVTAVAAVLFYWNNLEVVPVSGRTAFNCFSEEELRKIGKKSYERHLYDLERQGIWLLPQNAPAVRRVQRVMERLVPVAGPAAGEEAWEVNVVADDRLVTANAMVFPGNKVFVYSGMLRIAQTDDQLAAVLSHEIAHNIAKHGSERISGHFFKTIVGGGMLWALAASPFTLLARYWVGGAALGLIFTHTLGRTLESEADYIGLMMMAEACYDPRQAVTFWERLRHIHAQVVLLELPEYLSTHPSDQRRIENITKWLPAALEKREKSDCKGTQGFAEMFRRSMERREVSIAAM